MMLNQIAGYDSHDVASVEHAKEDYLESMKQPVSGLRLGIPRAPFFDQVDEETMKAVEAAIGVLSKLTKTTVECHLPSTAGFDNIGTALCAERLAYHVAIFRHKAQRDSLGLGQNRVTCI